MDTTEEFQEFENYRFEAGSKPLLISIPHGGTVVPPWINERLTPSAQRIPDTDFFLCRLYGRFANEGANVIWALHSRYVVDLNRPPDDTRLYAGATTGLFPTVQFDGQPIYRDGQQPDATERQARLAKYYQPYHDKLRQTLDEILDQFGYAILFDAHSILSQVPRLFEGKLPDFNVGTNDGKSASPHLVQQLVDVCRDATPYTHVVNGRFKGGYITRHYGQPERDIHAVQLEMAQSVYMREDGEFNYDEDFAGQVLPFLTKWVRTMLNWKPPE